MSGLRAYLVALSPGKMALWCYLIWYLVIAARYFDPAPGIWLNALGISGVIGIALCLGVRNPNAGPADRWQVFRLFLTPFCVSSFSALIKGKGFVLIFPPGLDELALAVGACSAFVAGVSLIKRMGSSSAVFETD